MLGAVGCKGQRKLSVGNAGHIFVGLKPYLCGGAVHRCLQPCHSCQSKGRFIRIQNQIPVANIGTVCSQCNIGDRNSLILRFCCRLRGRLSSRLGGFFAGCHICCAICVSVEHKIGFQGILAQDCPGRKGHLVLGAVGCQGQRKLSVGNAGHILVGLKPHLCGGAVHRCLQSCHSRQSKGRFIHIQNQIPVTAVGTIYAQCNIGDRNGLILRFCCRLRNRLSDRLGSRLGGLFTGFHSQSAVCVGVEYEIGFQGILAQCGSGGNGDHMLCLIGCQRESKAAGRYAELAVDLEPNLRGGIIHRCFQSADGGQREIRNIRI